MQRKEVTKPLEQNAEISDSFDSERKFKHERARHWLTLDILLCNTLNTKTRYRIHGLTTTLRGNVPTAKSKAEITSET